MMLTISNDQLVVSILDPVGDRERLGSRYVTGGYVYDVTDRKLGVVTSGPGYPGEVFPPVFDGQGLPEAFPDFLWSGIEAEGAVSRPEPGTKILVIGVGSVTATAEERFRVMPVDEFCEWEISRSPTSVVMKTQQSFRDWNLELRRDLRLVNRTLISETRLTNSGRYPIKSRWFPHPFFPNVKGEFCKFNLAVSCPDTSAYELLENGFIGARAGSVWDRAGNFQALPFSGSDRLVTEQRHPKLGLIVATCSYVPTWLPIWGNANTFSFEPYLDVLVAPKADSTWSIVYDF